MTIQTIHDEWNDVLYTWQKAEIQRRIPEPIAWVVWSDPAWTELDQLLDSDNLHSDLSDTGVACTLHEISPGKFVVWVQDTATQHSGEEIILINAGDLEKFREHGIWGINSDSLFGDWRDSDPLAESGRSETPILDRMTEGDIYGGGTDWRETFINTLNNFFGPGNWAEVPRTEDLSKKRATLDAWTIFSINVNGVGVYFDRVDGEPVWAYAPSEEVYWIRTDILAQFYPDWGVDFLLGDWRADESFTNWINK